jgi:uncharacterized protein with von Willebrand factor type A (vWA) domain
MFVDFFYKLKDVGIPVSPTSFLTLHKALGIGLVNSLEDFYTAARSILVKSERYFDIYDQVFAHTFQGADMPDPEGIELDEVARVMLEAWLQNPEGLAEILGMDEAALMNKWIGTGGYSPVGHSGYHPGGMRVGGISGNKSAVKVAMDRRYKDYSLSGPLTTALMGEALKRLRNLVPFGAKDQVNIDETIYQTMKNGGEIEIVFDRSLKDRLKVILAIDNGGWSMDPYVPLVQTLFDYARAQFKDVQTYFFHNTIYSTLWKDTARYKKPQPIDQFMRRNPETRLIIVGDASMAPYELMATDGSIHLEDRSGLPSLECLKFLAATFPHAVWLNPVSASMWDYTRTIAVIREIFPMFELTIDGLEQAVSHLMQK